MMLAAIHGASQSLVASIRRVLAGLHASKKLGGAGAVDAMLVRLYGPILFRGLSAANAAGTLPAPTNSVARVASISRWARKTGL